MFYFQIILLNIYIYNILFILIYIYNYKINKYNNIFKKIIYLIFFFFLRIIGIIYKKNGYETNLERQVPYP